MRAGNEALDTGSERGNEEERGSESVRKIGRAGINGVNGYNYDMPETISEEEALRLTGRESEVKTNPEMQVPKTGLYEDFIEIQENCPDQLKRVVGHLNRINDQMYYDEEDPYDSIGIDEAVSAYAAVAAYLDFGNLYDRELIIKGLRNKNNFTFGEFRIHTDIDKKVVEMLPEKYTPSEEAIPLSSALHIMHTNCPILRGKALEQESELKQALAKEKGVDLNLTDEVWFDVSEMEQLTGKDGFPEWLRPIVESKLDPWKDELVVGYSVTWFNSHIDNGDDYDYEEDEYPVVELTALDEATLDLAREALRGITQEEMKEAYEKSGE